MAAIFEAISRENLLAKLRELAAGTESLSLLATPEASTDEIVASFLNMFGGNRVEAKECFDCDLSNLISETLTALGVDEDDFDSLDYLGEIHDALEDAGISWE